MGGSVYLSKLHRASFNPPDIIITLFFITIDLDICYASSALCSPITSNATELIGNVLSEDEDLLAFVTLDLCPAVLVVVTLDWPRPPRCLLLSPIQVDQRGDSQYQMPPMKLTIQKFHENQFGLFWSQYGRRAVTKRKVESSHGPNILFSTGLSWEPFLNFLLMEEQFLCIRTIIRAENFCCAFKDIFLLGKYIFIINFPIKICQLLPLLSAS